MKDVALREDIPALYSELGMSTVEIGDLVGLSKGAVSSILRVRGVKCRNTRESLKAKFPNGRFGKDAAHWKGGRVRLSSGYIYIHAPDHPYASKDGYVMEHRLLMESKLGRFLQPSEVVHHINGVKDDNREENLEVLIRGQHVSKHFKAIDEVQELKAELEKYKEAFGDLPE